MTHLAHISGQALLLRVTLILAGLALAAWLLDALALWMERRGWLHWRKTERNGGGGATAGMLTELQKIVEPQTESRLEVLERSARRRPRTRRPRGRR